MVSTKVRKEVMPKQQPKAQPDPSWPALLRDLVQTYGADAVYQTGLHILGYPPTWITTASEVAILRRGLEIKNAC
jgi:hypothetical protein